MFNIINTLLDLLISVFSPIQRTQRKLYNENPIQHPEVQKEQRICINCKYFDGDRMCKRIKIENNPITGAERFEPIYAEYERMRDFELYRIGIDVELNLSRILCGKEGRFWTPK